MCPAFLKILSYSSWPCWSLHKYIRPRDYTKTIEIRNKAVGLINMIRNFVKFSARSPKINLSGFILRNERCDLYRVNVPSICSYQQMKCICSDSVGNNLLRSSSSSNPLKDYVRFKSKGQKSSATHDDSDDEDEEDTNENEYDEDGNKMMIKKVKSLRTDSLLSKCLGLTRRKIDELFLRARFRLNGEPLQKKGTELKPGDSLEVCTDPVDTGGTTEVTEKLNIIKVKPLQETSTYFVTFSVEKSK